MHCLPATPTRKSIVSKVNSEPARNLKIVPTLKMKQLDNLKSDLERCGYIADTGLTTTLYLADQLKRPVLLEGDAGVGKTAVAQTLAKQRQCELIRLQCYEGLDVNTALYEWNYQRQLMAVRIKEQHDVDNNTLETEIFSHDYLLQRPLLQAITTPQPAVLLIDEIDRSDDEFEAFLLEVLAEFQITIPELGTVQATHKPMVILTSNATRDLSDALRRRCLYHFVDYPSFEKELRILHHQLPDLPNQLAESVVAFIQRLRQQNLKKTPGIAESLDWASALLHMQTTELEQALPQIEATLGCLLKTRADRELADRAWLQQLLEPSKPLTEPGSG